jgi:hypothetical protein
MLLRGSLGEIRTVLDERCSREEISQAAQLIVGSYPTRGAVDPDVYVRQLAAVLASYPRSIVEQMIDPAHGIVAVSKFLPTIAEVKEFGEGKVIHLHRKLERTKNDIRQLAPPEPTEQADPEYVQKRVAELKANLISEPENQDPEMQKRIKDRLRRTQSGYGQAVTDSDLVKTAREPIEEGE